MRQGDGEESSGQPGLGTGSFSEVLTSPGSCQQSYFVDHSPRPPTLPDTEWGHYY